MTLLCLVSRVLILGRKTARAKKLLRVLVHGPRLVLMGALFLWKLATLTTVRLLIWDGSPSTCDHGTVANGDAVGTGTTGMLTAGRCIKTNICILPKMTGDITGDRGST